MVCRRLLGRMSAGFSLVELLVVVAIIAILVALILPAVQAAREAARRVHCANQLKQIALATHGYESSHAFFPSGAIVDDSSCAALPETRRGPPWTAFLLPYVEAVPLFDQMDTDGQFFALANNGEPSGSEAAQLTPQPLFKCPSDPAHRAQDPSTNYLGVQGGGPPSAAECQTGMTSQNARLRFDNGILCTNGSIGFASIRDGASNTFLIGESRWWAYQHTNVAATNWFSWASANRTDGSSSHPIVLAAAVDPINHPIVDYDAKHRWVDGDGNPTNGLYLGTHTRAFGSWHPGGCHLALGDGSVHFFDDGMDLDIYRQMGARSDGRPLGGIRP